MTQSTLQSRQSERGFTLVELAIVMIIIGLLIGGILKGQELINNARVSSTAAQAKAVESGVSTFRDKYAGLPGDILTPNTRIADCANLCANAGNGDSRVQASAANDPGAIVTTSEGANAFPQMAAAGMIGGVDGGATTEGVAGTSNPTTPVGGAWAFGYSDGSTNGTGLTSAGAPQSGHYIVSLTDLGTAAGPTNVPFTPAQAANLDRKLDDGAPNAGTVRSVGNGAGTTAGNCATATDATGVYNEALASVDCGLYIKIQ